MGNEAVYWIPKKGESLADIADIAWMGISGKLGTRDYLLPEIRGVNKPAGQEPGLVRYEVAGELYAVFEDAGEGVVARFGADRERFLEKIKEAMNGANYHVPLVPTPAMERSDAQKSDVEIPEQYLGVFND